MRRNIYDSFLLCFVAVILYETAHILAPFAGALVAALVCAVTFHPMYLTLGRWTPKASPTFRAILADILVLIFFVTPLVLLLWMLTTESNSLVSVLKQGSSAVAQWREGNILDSMPWMDHVRFFLTKAFGIKRAQFQENVIESVNRGLEYISITGTLLARHMLVFALNLLVMLFALFFMFRDGPQGVEYIEKLIPMRQKDKEKLTIRIRVVIISIVRGLFLTSLIQGILATAGYLVVGAEGAVLLGASTAFMGLIPVVGTFGIWVPASVFFLLKGSYVKGVFLLLWGLIVVVGFVDVFARPYLVGKKTHLSALILFFALLGGVDVWGTKGVILGPLVIAVTPVLLDLYRERFSREEEAY